MGCSKCGSKAKSAIHGATGIMKASAGLDRADEAVIESRRSICRSCEHAMPCVSNVGRKCRCKLCGCLLRAKTALAHEKCPGGKW